MDANYLISRRQVSTEYEVARRRATKRALGAAIRRQRRSLLSVEEVKAGLVVHGERYAGVQQVRAHSIVSSLGRAGDFDSQFGPLHDWTRERWIRVANAHLHGTDLPPVHLLKIGDAYVVIDGNHRVSVARHFGVEYMDAEIIECLTSCVPARAPSTRRREVTLLGSYNFRLRSLLGQRS